jgi:hypothetical protein
LVTFSGTGTCTIDANQAGNTTYSAAAQMQEVFNVVLATQTIKFTSTAPSPGFAGTTYSPIATVNSPLTVAITIDKASTSGCTINSSGVVNLGTAGTCVVDANQPGDNVTYGAAAQVQQQITVVTPVLAFTQQPSSIQPLPKSNPFYFSCPIVQLETSGLTPISAAVSITLTLIIPTTNPATPDPNLTYLGAQVEPTTGPTVTTNGSTGAVEFGTGTPPSCTSGLIATAVGEGYELSASAPATGAAPVASNTFDVANSVTPCPSSCSSPNNTSNTGASGSVGATSNGIFGLITSFGVRDTLNCESAVSKDATDPFLVAGTPIPNGATTVTVTITMVFSKKFVEDQPQNQGTPHMNVCAGATQQFPNSTFVVGNTQDPWQGLLLFCTDPNYMSSTAPFKWCIQSESKNGANVETVVTTFTGPANIDPHIV